MLFSGDKLSEIKMPEPNIEQLRRRQRANSRESKSSAPNVNLLFKS